VKKKIKFLTPNDASKWYCIANMFAKSLLPQKEAISQYNSLTPTQRNEIAQKFQTYDKLRRTRITASDENAESRWETSIMVDAHIIAAEYDIDPITVIMCFKAPCKNNEEAGAVFAGGAGADQRRSGAGKRSRQRQRRRN
jgi:hypothetical protein